MALLSAAGQALASAVLDLLMEQAISAAANEFKLIRGVHKEIQKLAFTLTVIQRVLEDAEERQLREAAIGDWLRQLKQVFLDADDLLDEYATDAALQAPVGAERRKKVCAMLFRCFSFISRTVSGRATAHQICDINQRLDHLVQVKNQFDLKVLPKGSSRLEHTRRPQTGSILADVSSVIGRDNEKEMIIELLLSSTDHEPESSSNNRSFSVLPIVGMGGLGKTTLARLVFNDENIRKHFELMMWVCVSNDFDRTRLTKEMIDAASAHKGKNEPCQITHWDSMQLKLRQEVEGRTFLLVLDDVWEASRSQWENLFEPLKFASNGSKILVTTRNRNAVDISEGRMRPIILRGLSDDDLWLLFKRCAFVGFNEEEYVHLEEMGRQIAKRLKGLPLAAKTIGSLLNTKLDVKYWRKIGKSEMWKLQQDEDEESILPVLELSYQYLPGNLKQCFAYCSLFPKDCNFDKTELAQLWDAEFFSGKRCMGREDISSEYFDNLLHRSFFEPSPNYDGDYVIHDLTHDLAEYVSRDDCFRLEDQRSVEIADTVRHMSLLVTKFDQTMLNELCRQVKLRTLLFLGQRCKFDDPTHALDELFSKLKRLRVLRLSGCGITELPSSIGDLKHLRYIDLSRNDRLENLPESLGNLYNLQVLRLDNCKSLRALPSRMSELINLRDLRLPRDRSCDMFSSIDGLGRLTALQGIEVRGRKVTELGGMGMLRELKISSLEEVGAEEAIQARLDSKGHLQRLKLEWRTARDATSINREVEEEVLQALRPPVDSIEHLSICGYGGAKSSDWMVDPSTWPSFCCLQSVTLSHCPNWEVLPGLGQLRLLEKLEIDNMPSARELDLRFFPLQDGDHHHQPQRNPFFPRLRRLEIDSCPELRELPPLPPTLTTLMLIDVGLTCLPGLWEGRRGGDDREATSSSSSSCSSSVSAALSHLEVERCRNLRSVSGLLEHRLTALEMLDIFDCEELASLPERGFGHLVSLNTLFFAHCPKLTCPPPLTREEEEDAPSQHLPISLEQLRIAWCSDAMGGWWWAGLQHLTSLASLDLLGCPSTAASLFVSLRRHPHHHLASTLTELQIKECDYQQQSRPSTSSSLPPPPLPQNPPPEDATAGGLRALTSLRKLTISKSPNLLRKWGGSGLLSSLRKLSIEEDDDLDDGCLSTCLQYLTSLEYLQINRCPAITSLPAGAVEDHHHQAALLHPLTMAALQTLYIEDCEELASLGHLTALPSLKTLLIKCCPKLNLLQISSSSSSRSSLKEFFILNSSPQQMREWLLQSNLVFPFLQRLDITNCPQLTSFEEDGGGKELEAALLHLAPSLRSLSFRYCENLRSLPATLSCLPSLESLTIYGCPQIQSSPEAGLPASLRGLYIGDCPTLEERCRDRGVSYTGEWRKLLGLWTIDN